MLKKFIAIILVISSFTLCATGICFADCNKGGKPCFSWGKIDNRGINDGSSPPDFTFPMAKECINDMCHCRTNALKTKVGNMNFFKTALKNKDKSLLKTIAVSALVGSGIGTAIGGTLAGRFILKDDVKNGVFNNGSGFCNNACQVLEAVPNCGISLQCQKETFYKAVHEYQKDRNIMRMMQVFGTCKIKSQEES